MQITTIGLDIAKNVFQGNPPVSGRLTEDRWFVRLLAHLLAR